MIFLSAFPDAAHSGVGVVSLRIFEQMNQQGIQPDEICFNEIIRIHAKQQAPEKAKEILTLARKLQTQLFDVLCFISILDILWYCIGVVLLVEESLHQLRFVVYPIIWYHLQGFIHPRWLAGLLPSTVWFDVDVGTWYPVLISFESKSLKSVADVHGKCTIFDA